MALLERLGALAAERAAPLHVALQVNVDADPAKSGFAPGELLEAAPQIAALALATPLCIDGLLTVGRLVEEAEAARATFVAFRRFCAAFESAAAAARLPLGPLRSAGMSGDFEVAIEEGATQVRLGSALFGPRG